jgi:hypothetical protein
MCQQAKMCQKCDIFIKTFSPQLNQNVNLGPTPRQTRGPVDRNFLRAERVPGSGPLWTERAFHLWIK